MAPTCASASDAEPCASLLDAATQAGEVAPGTDAFALLFAVGNLCAGAGRDDRYDARRMVALLVAGLRVPAAPTAP